jgi:hypothetical protein
MLADPVVADAASSSQGFISRERPSAARCAMLAAVRLAGSIAIHALFALLLVSIHHAHEDASAPPQVELVDVAIAPPAVAPITPSPGAALGGSPARRSARRAAMPVPRTASLGELAIEPMGDGAPGAGGRGGIGLGDGRGLADLVPEVPAVPAPPPAPPAPKVSKARPARLIYPSRQTEVDEDQLFVADVIVDTDGFVVGAKLAKGRGGPRDVEAGAAVWRFRYDPALDDEGVRMRSSVHQTFAVAW